MRGPVAPAAPPARRIAAALSSRAVPSGRPRPAPALARSRGAAPPAGYRRASPARGSRPAVAATAAERAVDVVHAERSAMPQALGRGGRCCFGRRTSRASLARRARCDAPDGESRAWRARVARGRRLARWEAACCAGRAHPRPHRARRGGTFGCAGGALEALPVPSPPRLRGPRCPRAGRGAWLAPVGSQPRRGGAFVPRPGRRARALRRRAAPFARCSAGAGVVHMPAPPIRVAFRGGISPSAASLRASMKVLEAGRAGAVVATQRGGGSRRYPAVERWCRSR